MTHTKPTNGMGTSDGREVAPPRTSRYTSPQLRVA